MTNSNTDKAGRRRRLFFLIAAGLLLDGASCSRNGEGTLLKLLGITPSAESVDYVVHKTPFQLHTLLTEQRHPKTWDLSGKIQTSTEDGLRMLFGVD